MAFIDTLCLSLEAALIMFMFMPHAIGTYDLEVISWDTYVVYCFARVVYCFAMRVNFPSVVNTLSA
jgi:hypothetical protein